MDKRPPLPPRNILPVRPDRPLNGTNNTKGPITGPQARRFDPNQGPEQRFKGGEKPSKANVCKKRYQQISITAIGNLGSSTTSRILQTSTTPPIYTMTLEVGTTIFSSAVTKLAAFAVLVAFISTVSFSF